LTLGFDEGKLKMIKTVSYCSIMSISNGPERRQFRAGRLKGKA